MFETAVRKCLLVNHGPKKGKLKIKFAYFKKIKKTSFRFFLLKIIKHISLYYFIIKKYQLEIMNFF